MIFRYKINCFSPPVSSIFDTMTIPRMPNPSSYLFMKLRKKYGLTKFISKKLFYFN